jgi:rare lipoprotein A
MSTHRISEAPLLPVVFSPRSPRPWSTWLVVPLLAGCSGLPFLGGSSKPAGDPVPIAVAAPPPAPPAQPPSPVEAPPAPAAVPNAANEARTAPARPRVNPPDAVPRVERIPQREPNRPYIVRGDAYEPMSQDLPLQQTGVASWYGEPFHGRRTANGEVYDMNLMTAAHKTMPLPSYALVRNLRNGRQIVVRVNDRGPFKYDRVIDLSRAAAHKLGFTGLAQVEVRRLTHAEIRTGSWKFAPQTLADLGSLK